MPSITPHLWFDTQAKEAAEFYTSIFPDSEITNISVLKNTPSGDCDVVSFRVCGQDFMSISAGPYFTINPSISFMINFDPSRDANARENLDRIWGKLSEGGTALMPLDTYPFSDRYGWIQDKYGVSWQLILTKAEGEPRPMLIPSLMFTGDRTGEANEAIDFYVSVFKDSPSAGSGQAKRGLTAEYPPGASPEPAAKIMFAEFMLLGQWFTAMDSGHMHKFGFNEAVSLMVNCDTQEEIDEFWDKLSAVPESEQCGWLKDRFGVSWQITPAVMNKMLSDPDETKVARVTQAFLQMKKFDIAALQKAYEGA
jgi:predicted 3-demethylubiquinone-9 3-methyltransferase (glyoxalase superfamily)